MAIDENIKSQLVDLKSLNTAYDRALKQTNVSSSKSAFPTFSNSALYSMLLNNGTITLKNKARNLFSTSATHTYKAVTQTNGSVSAFAFELKNILVSSKCLVDTFIMQNFIGNTAETSDTQIYSNGTISIFPGILTKGVPTTSDAAKEKINNLEDNNIFNISLELSGTNAKISKTVKTAGDINELTSYTSTLTIEGGELYEDLVYIGSSDIKTTVLDEKTKSALYVNGGIYSSNGICATKIFNSVWNDIADCITVDCELESGYCYMFDGKHYNKTTKYADDRYIGIHSDTAGFYVGQKGGNELHVAIGGFVLAHVDKEYPVGTPLTCTSGGRVTKMKKLDTLLRPYRIIGTYWKPETEKTWGPKGQGVRVNGRHWIKIK